MSLFFCKISQKNVFENILVTKKSFEDYKIEKLKKSKNWDFSKELVHGFGQKVKMWPCFFFLLIRQKMCLSIF